jgi:hypothetical protein
VANSGRDARRAPWGIFILRVGRITLAMNVYDPSVHGSLKNSDDVITLKMG